MSETETGLTDPQEVNMSLLRHLQNDGHAVTRMNSGHERALLLPCNCAAGCHKVASGVLVLQGQGNWWLLDDEEGGFRYVEMTSGMVFHPNTLKKYPLTAPCESVRVRLLDTELAPKAALELAAYYAVSFEQPRSGEFFLITGCHRCGKVAEKSCILQDERPAGEGFYLYRREAALLMRPVHRVRMRCTCSQR